MLKMSLFYETHLTQFQYLNNKNDLISLCSSEKAQALHMT